MKKLLCGLFAFLILFSAGFSLADEDIEKTVSAPGFVAIDASDPDTLIYSKNPDRQLAPASTTKIMTCILTLENCPDLDEVITVDPASTKLGSTNTLMGLRKGESLPIRELLYGLMLPSGNDAAIALACHIAGSVEAFAEMMNAKAAELGMEHTNFVTASGVYKGNHYSTARDMAILAAYAMQNETFRQIVSTPNHTVPANDVRKNELYLENTNNLIQKKKSEYYEYAIGCKTGSTVQGGKCLVAAAEKDGTTLIVVLLGLKDGGTKGYRIHKCFKDAAAVFENIFATYRSVSSDDLTLNIKFGQQQVSVENASDDDPEHGLLTLNADFTGQTVSMRDDLRAMLQDDPGLLTASVELNDGKVSAPVREGEQLGTVSLNYKGRTLFSSPLTASRSVEEYSAPVSTPVPTAVPAEPVATHSSSPDIAQFISSGSGLKLFLALFVFLLIIAAFITLVFLLVKKLTRRK